MSLILVVDDDKTVCKLVRAYLDGTGYEVMEASNAFEAEELVYKYRVALMLVDINMPFQNGFDFVQKIKRSTRNKLISTVFLTSRSEKKDIQRALNLDVDGYIVKPFDKKDFVKKIEELFSKKEAVGPEYLSRNVKELKIQGQVFKPIEVFVESVSELGIEVIVGYDYHDFFDRDQVCEVILKSNLWGHIGIEPQRLKYDSSERLAGSLKFKVKFRFDGINHENIDLIKKWVLKGAI